MDRITREMMLMTITRTVAQRSTCLRKQVGAVIARDGRVLSTGYAGAPSGIAHCSPETCNQEQPCTRTVHAEANAIAFAAREGISINGAHLYCTMSPCIHCAKLIINSGIKCVVYFEPYRDTSPIDYLSAAGIMVIPYVPPLE